jgi:N-acetylglucosaminyl-diphospho-decaprenol L-rhamnosyltransferase
MTEPVADPSPRIAAVIVTYNSAAVIAGCLESLHDQGVDLRAVVVADNNSTDTTLDIVRAATDLPIRCVQLGRNAGYAAAINAGVAALDLADIDAVFVLNPDCRLRPQATARLAARLREPGCGITVPRLINPDGSLQPSLRRRPTVGRAAAEAVLGGTRAGRIGGLGELVTDEGSYATARPAAWATGAAMLVSTRLIADVGDWDESFLLYSEETEYALRAADHGWALWYEPTAEIVHIGGESGTNPMLASLLTVNRVTLFRRRHNLVHAGAYFAAVGLGEGIRALAGRATSKASVTALLRPSRRVRELPQ